TFVIIAFSVCHDFLKSKCPWFTRWTVGDVKASIRRAAHQHSKADVPGWPRSARRKRGPSILRSVDAATSRVAEETMGSCQSEARLPIVAVAPTTRPLR